MVGTVTKLEANVVDHYSESNRFVAGTNVTITHQVYRPSDDAGKQVASVVFLPPNSVLPNIGDDIEISLETMG